MTSVQRARDNRWATRYRSREKRTANNRRREKRQASGKKWRREKAARPVSWSRFSRSNERAGHATTNKRRAEPVLAGRAAPRSIRPAGQTRALREAPNCAPYRAPGPSGRPSPSAARCQTRNRQRPSCPRGPDRRPRRAGGPGIFTCSSAHYMPYQRGQLSSSVKRRKLFKFIVLSFQNSETFKY